MGGRKHSQKRSKRSEDGTSGLSPQEAAGLAQIERVRGLAWHMGTFAAMMTWMGAPGWGLFWLLGLVSHFGTTVPAMQKVFGDGFAKGIARLSGSEPLLLDAPLPSAEVDPVQTPAEAEPEPAADDPLGRQLAEEWERLDALRDSLDAGVIEQLAAAQTALQEVIARRDLVRAHLLGEDEDSLRAEAAELETEMAGTADTRTQEVLGQALSALQARTAAVVELRGAELRLGARARATLHQLKSIRMSLVSSDAGDPSGRTALSALTDELRQEARSAAELEEALAGARANPTDAVTAHARRARETS